MFKRDDTVVLLSTDGRRHLLTIEGTVQKVPGLGVIDTSQLVGERAGSSIRIGEAEFRAYAPTVLDLVSGIKRGAQIIAPKDSALIAMWLDVHSGSRVVEGGIGSGALTIALANLVRPDGVVSSYELREDFAKAARRNIGQAGMSQWVTVRIGDITKRIEESDVDAFFIDIPTPWEAVRSAVDALRPGGVFGAYSPSYNQTERVVKELRQQGFFDVRSMEILEREIVVGDRSTRPSTEMLGHTGYLIFGRRP